MRKYWIAVGMALSGLMALGTACSDGGTGGGGSGAVGGSGGTGNTGNTGSGATGPCVPGAATCGSLDGAWDQTLGDTDFDCTEGYDAYVDLQACACDETAIGTGCGAICDGDKNGTGTPNWCNGVAALPQCATCLSDVCGSAYDACLAN
jgi:hypothetical protein